MRSFWLAVALLLSRPVVAGEGIPDRASGRLLTYRGYPTRGELPAIRFDVNRIKFDATQWFRWTFASAEETRLLLTDLSIAFGVWENAPHVRVRFGWGYYRPRWEESKADGSNLVSVTRWTSPQIGMKKGNPKKNQPYLMIYSVDSYDDPTGVTLHLAPTTDGARIAEFDIWHESDLLGGDLGRRGLAFDVGQGIGFNRSGLAGDAVMGYSYGARAVEAVEQGTVTPDDLAIAAELYPDDEYPIFRTTGTIVGRAMSEDGNRQLYGAFVGLYDRETYLPVMHGISGFRFAKSGHGDVQINGVPPGNYTLILEPYSFYVPVLVLGEPSPFDRDFSAGTIKNITILPGEIVDLGEIHAAVTRDYRDRTLRIRVPAETKFRFHRAKIRKAGAGPMVSEGPEYWEGRERILAVPAGWYEVSLWGSNDYGKWALVQDWTLYDCRIVELIENWQIQRDVNGTFGVGYSIFLWRWSSKWEHAQTLRGVRGNAYRGMAIPGYYAFGVGAEDKVARTWSFFTGWRWISKF